MFGHYTHEDHGMGTCTAFTLGVIVGVMGSAKMRMMRKMNRHMHHMHYMHGYGSSCCGSDTNDRVDTNINATQQAPSTGTTDTVSE